MGIVASYSFLRDEENCPHKAQHRYVLRDLPRETSKEMDEGNRIHKSFERRVNEAQKLPDDLSWAEQTIANVIGLRDHGCHVFAEQQLGLLENGRPCGFFDDDVYLRGKLDLTICDPLWTSAVFFDWKNGNPREETFELEIAGLLLQALRPSVKSMVGHFVWTKTRQLGPPHDVSNTARTMSIVQEQMNIARARQGEWPKRKNPLCGWCNVTTCENWKPRT